MSRKNSTVVQYYVVAFKTCCSPHYNLILFTIIYFYDAYVILYYYNYNIMFYRNIEFYEVIKIYRYVVGSGVPAIRHARSDR